MLLIHVPKLTNRLGYTLKIIFNHVLHAEYSITTDEQFFLQHGDAKLCYGQKRLGDNLFIKSHSLLFETTIEEQEPHAECRDGQWILYPVYGRDLDFDFDLLAATFFMVTRYEEYLPHREDEHGRFFPQDSLAMQEGFLEQPVVDQWARIIRSKLEERYPDFKLPRQGYRFVQTVDIDAAWRYLHKGTFRTVMGAGRDLFSRHQPDEVWRRFRVLLRKEPDPYDTFDYILETQKKAPGSHMIFFALLVPLAAFAAEPAKSVSRTEIASIISEFRHYDGVEVIKLGRLATGALKGVVSAAGMTDPDTREALKMIDEWKSIICPVEMTALE